LTENKLTENNNEKLQRFTSAIMAEAQAEADAIYDEIKRESNEFLSAVKKEARAEMSHFTSTEEERIKADCGRRLSRAVMSNKREMYLRREEIADEVVFEVKKKLEEYVKTPGYVEYLREVLTFTLTAFKGDATVLLRPEDMGLAAQLGKIPYENKLTFKEGTFSLGGMEVSCRQRNLHADATFDYKIINLRERFAELFGLSLED